MTNVTLYPHWTLSSGRLQAAEANPSADVTAFVSETSGIYQYVNHAKRFWSKCLMFLLLLLFQGTVTSHQSTLLFIFFWTFAVILLKYSNINLWWLSQGVFLAFFSGIKVFYYQRNLTLLNSELDLNCMPCQSLLIQVAVRASRPHMFWQVNGKVTWKTPRQDDTVIK